MFTESFIAMGCSRRFPQMS
uniref:Uncharacterized protein n=1 Tax=Rhizophora mucronata TaxID=61149 RepID=A0A2P2QFY5_RHIMU